MQHALPPDLPARLATAVQTAWAPRAARSAAPLDLDGLLGVLGAVATHCGLPASAVRLRGRAPRTVPGHFATGCAWDAVVVEAGRLRAVVGVSAHSLRTSGGAAALNAHALQVVGAAVDLAAAAASGALGPEAVTRRPFVGWLMVLEDTPEAHAPLPAPALEGFGPSAPSVSTSASPDTGAERARRLCERLTRAGHCHQASLLLTAPSSGAAQGAWRALSELSHPAVLLRLLADHLTSPPT